MDPAVQQQMRERYASLQATIDRAGVPQLERANAYGQLGMLLHAAEYYDAAEPAYLNAQTLAPDDARWPYFLAHLYKNRGDTDRSVAAFNRVLELRPNDAPTLIWLGRAALERGDADRAATFFARADAAAPRTVAVLAGLGQAALLKKDYSRAATTLEQALAIDPSAASLHSPLATAYRALGDTAKAEAHARLWKNSEILVPDPVRQELDLALGSGLSFELRGVRALEARDFPAAVSFFKQGVAVSSASTTLGRSLRHKLGTALYMSGDAAAAEQQFNEVIRTAPADGVDETAGRAHYSLGVLLASRGDIEPALMHLQAAVSYSPTYVEARQAFGDVLRRAHRDAEALPQYQEALRLDPQAATARFGYAMALVRLKRYREARDWLSEAMRIHRDRPEFTHALARLLAAAPDDAVRDGPRALMLIDELLKGPKSIALGETTAMALAENGRFDEAVAVQRQVIDAARTSGEPADAAYMTANLRAYEARRPCRAPWSDAVSIPSTP